MRGEKFRVEKCWLFFLLFFFCGAKMSKKLEEANSFSPFFEFVNSRKFRVFGNLLFRDIIYIEK